MRRYIIHLKETSRFTREVLASSPKKAVSKVLGRHRKRFKVLEVESVVLRDEAVPEPFERSLNEFNHIESRLSSITNNKNNNNTQSKNEVRNA